VSRTPGAVAVVGRAGELGTLRRWFVHDTCQAPRSGAHPRSPETRHVTAVRTSPMLIWAMPSSHACERVGGKGVGVESREKTNPVR
jgi:hypothetical protein